MAVYFCAGKDRVDDDGVQVCDFKSDKRWPGRCPKCKKPFSVIKLGADRATNKLSTAAKSNNPDLEVKHIKTGVSGFDLLTNGGVVLSQVILMAGGPGTRKTSLMLQVLDGLTSRTDRPLLYASAEQNDNDVLMFCRMLGVASDQLKIMGNAGHIEDILAICRDLRPLMCVFDSLQAISDNSGVSPEALSKRIEENCKETKMVGVMIQHMTKTLDIKGGTGPAHYADTVLAFEPFIPQLDGDPHEMFGRRVMADCGLEVEDSNEAVENLRLLKAVIKNRYGSIGTKAYYCTLPDGGIKELKVKSKLAAV